MPPRAQVLTRVTDVADGAFDLSSSSLFANGGFLVIGGTRAFTNGIRLDLSPLANQTLLDFSVTTTSVDQLTLGQTGSLPFGYYIGGFTDRTSGATLATQQYVAAGTLNFEVVPVAFASLTGILFTGNDLKTLAQSWIDSPSTNYGFVFSGQAPELAALYRPSGGPLNTRETGSDTPFGTAISVPEPQPAPLALAAGAVAFAIREVNRRRKKLADLENGNQKA